MKILMTLVLVMSSAVTAFAKDKEISLESTRARAVSDRDEDMALKGVLEQKGNSNGENHPPNCVMSTQDENVNLFTQKNTNPTKENSGSGSGSTNSVGH